MITGGNLPLNYSNQKRYCELVNIFGVPFITSPVNIFIRHS